MEKPILIFAIFSTNKILLAALRTAIAVCLSPPHLMAQKGTCIAHAECQSSQIRSPYNLRYAVRAGKMPHRTLRDPPSMSDILAHDSIVRNPIPGSTAGHPPDRDHALTQLRLTELRPTQLRLKSQDGGIGAASVGSSLE